MYACCLDINADLKSLMLIWFFFFFASYWDSDSLDQTAVQSVTFGEK